MHQQTPSPDHLSWVSGHCAPIPTTLAPGLADWSLLFSVFGREIVSNMWNIGNIDYGMESFNPHKSCIAYRIDNIYHWLIPKNFIYKKRLGCIVAVFITAPPTPIFLWIRYCVR